FADLIQPRAKRSAKEDSLFPPPGGRSRRGSSRQGPLQPEGLLGASPGGPPGGLPEPLGGPQGDLEDDEEGFVSPFFQMTEETPEEPLGPAEGPLSPAEGPQYAEEEDGGPPGYSGQENPLLSSLRARRQRLARRARRASMKQLGPQGAPADSLTLPGGLQGAPQGLSGQQSGEPAPRLPQQAAVALDLPPGGPLEARGPPEGTTAGPQEQQPTAPGPPEDLPLGPTDSPAWAREQAEAPFRNGGAPFTEGGAPFREEGAPFGDVEAPFGEVGAPWVSAAQERGRTLSVRSALSHARRKAAATTGAAAAAAAAGGPRGPRPGKQLVGRPAGKAAGRGSGLQLPRRGPQRETEGPQEAKAGTAAAVLHPRSSKGPRKSDILLLPPESRAGGPPSEEGGPRPVRSLAALRKLLQKQQQASSGKQLLQRSTKAKGSRGPSEKKK
ncbi:hypothetical protein ETH_00011360, partial [Eimeria tenella]